MPAVCSGRAHTGERQLALAGTEYGGDNGYDYAGLLSPLPGSDLGNAFVQKHRVDWLGYDNGARSNTKKASGAVIALGFKAGTEKPVVKTSPVTPAANWLGITGAVRREESRLFSAVNR